MISRCDATQLRITGQISFSESSPLKRNDSPGQGDARPTRAEHDRSHAEVRDTFRNEDDDDEQLHFSASA